MSFFPLVPLVSVFSILNSVDTVVTVILSPPMKSCVYVSNDYHSIYDLNL